MAKLKDFSTTADDNNAAAPNGFPEGMAPSAVNNAARQLMASIREWYEDAEWLELGHEVVSASGDQIVFTGDQSGTYKVGRSVKADGTAGVITAVSVVSNTTVTVSGITFSGTPTTFEVGVIFDTITATLIATALGYEPVSKDGLDANLSAGNYRITDLAAPVDSTDAANKSYVNSLLTLGGDPADVAITDLDKGALGTNEVPANVGGSLTGATVAELEPLINYLAVHSGVI